MEQKKYWIKGISPIMAAAFLFGIYVFILKLNTSRISPLQLVFCVSCFVTIGLLIVIRFNIRPVIATFREHPWHYLALSLLGVVLGESLLFYALNHLDLGVCVLLEKLEPVFTLILAALILGEHHSKRKYVAAGLAVIASYFVAVEQPLAINLTNSEISGLLAILSAAFCWGITSVIGRSLILKNIAPTSLVLLRYGLGAVMLIPVVYCCDPLNPSIFYDSQVVTVLILLAILLLIGMLSYYRGLFHVPAAVAGFVKLITPVVSLLLGIIVLGERLSETQRIAIPLMLFLVYRISVPEKR